MFDLRRQCAHRLFRCVTLVLGLSPAIPEIGFHALPGVTKALRQVDTSGDDPACQARRFTRR